MCISLATFVLWRRGLQSRFLDRQSARAWASALPQRLEPSETIALARWRGERHGAVLFIRLWRNGQFASEVAITERSRDGSWAEPSMSAGGPSIDEPLVSPSAGWDGDPVLWLGMTGSGDCIAVRGAAAKTIAAIGLEHTGRHSQFEIESPSGAFVVGIENPQQPALFGLAPRRSPG